MDSIQALPKILLIEDEPLIGKAYKDGLERAQFEVKVAPTGEEGLAMVKSWQPDLVLLDLLLPKIDGFEVLIELKKDEKIKKIPVIILTVSGSDSDLQKSKRMGALDYLVKTELSMQQIVMRLRFHLM